MSDLFSARRDWHEGEGDDEHRHRCLVRGIIKMRIQDRQKAHVWLNGGVDGTGKRVKGWNELHPGSILERDIRNQWAKGNRGEDGDWK